ncbi:hypothetical protein FA13DRAFT_1724012 [Coprinellus micaceus]|uniref:50S ribosomal protein L35 n=1 Tax=Coprinellus micaceus TaxID=71717 RepID=A0A4Y7U0K4_COPMI|nr:hypothetical protein FA13DRAFT_1724012 [Coprinellus micaceus]
MLGARFAGTCQAILRSPLSFNPARSFSMSPIVEAGYKLKSHSGAKKRWRSLGASSVFKRGKAGHSHLNVHKAPGRKNQLSTTAYSTPRQTVNLNKRLLPYGSN